MTRNKDGETKIREPIVEGLFYPESREKLSLAVQGFMAASTIPEGRAMGILCPHAAYEFTGGIIADAFRSVSLCDPRRIVIIGPVHREQCEELFLPESSFFRTALGDVPVDTRVIKEILDSGTLFSQNDIPHLEEHTVETCLPFIQILFPDRPILPILTGTTSKAIVRALVSGLKVTLGNSLDKTLFIISSNLGPYLPTQESQKYASAFLGLLEKGDWQELTNAYTQKTIRACGTGGAAALLLLGEGTYRPTILSRRASNIQPEADRTVQYAAVKFDRE